MTRIHGLQHVKRFLAAHLPDYDAVRPHAQAVDQQLALAHGALAFDIGGPGFEPHHMRLFQLQLGRVLDSHNTLLGRNKRRHRV